MTSHNREGGARGEVFLQAGDKNYPVLFTNRAIFKAERIIGKPVLQITNALTDQTLSMGDLVRLLLIGMEEGRRDARQGGRTFGLDDAWKVLDIVGFRGVLVKVFDALAQVLSYSQEADDQETDALPPEG